MLIQNKCKIENTTMENSVDGANVEEEARE
jgi:hypothetical protein